jgi:hypothetical protein
MEVKTQIYLKRINDTSKIIDVNSYNYSVGFRRQYRYQEPSEQCKRKPRLLGWKVQKPKLLKVIKYLRLIS